VSGSGRSEPIGSSGDGEDGVVVTPQIDRQVLHGSAGMRAMPAEARFDTHDAQLFEAEIVRAQLGPVLLRRTAMTAHRAIVDGYEAGVDSGVLRFVTLKKGTLLVAAPGGKPVRMEVGDALFTCRPRTYIYQANAPLVVVSSTVPISSLPAIVRRLEDLPIGPLPHAPLVDAVVDLLLQLADRLDESWGFDADYAARGLLDLETAILTEIIAPRLPVPGPDRVHTAALQYIERHLGEPELRPPQIAEALGVSLRYLHRAFDDKETTVARHLRERRLDQVAAALRSGGRNPPLQSIATRYGFGSQDQLARAFRRRYGMSMTEYRSADTG
jgi:AraC-like DNA-binding protein